MRRQIIIAAATVVVALVVIVIGLIAGPGRSGAATPAQLTGHTWTLTRLIVGGSEQVLSSDNPITLKFNPQDHSISGHSGCNAYGASYTITGNQIKITDMRSTLIFCSDAGVRELEATYTDALRHVETYHIEGDTLTLEGASGQVLMTFI